MNNDIRGRPFVAFRRHFRRFGGLCASVAARAAARAAAPPGEQTSV
jgi:hypothetical protein